MSCRNILFLLLSVMTLLCHAEIRQEIQLYPDFSGRFELLVEGSNEETGLHKRCSKVFGNVEQILNLFAGEDFFLKHYGYIDNNNWHVLVEFKNFATLLKNTRAEWLGLEGLKFEPSKKGMNFIYQHGSDQDRLKIFKTLSKNRAVSVIAIRSGEKASWFEDFDKSENIVSKAFLDDIYYVRRREKKEVIKTSPEISKLNVLSAYWESRFVPDQLSESFFSVNLTGTISLSSKDKLLKWMNPTLISGGFNSGTCNSIDWDRGKSVSDYQWSSSKPLNLRIKRPAQKMDKFQQALIRLLALKVKNKVLVNIGHLKAGKSLKYSGKVFKVVALGPDYIDFYSDAKAEQFGYFYIRTAKGIYLPHVSFTESGSNKWRCKFDGKVDVGECLFEFYKDYSYEFIDVILPEISLTNLSSGKYKSWKKRILLADGGKSIVINPKVWTRKESFEKLFDINDSSLFVRTVYKVLSAPEMGQVKDHWFWFQKAVFGKLSSDRKLFKATRKQIESVLLMLVTELDDSGLDEMRQLALNLGMGSLLVDKACKFVEQKKERGVSLLFTDSILTMPQLKDLKLLISVSDDKAIIDKGLKLLKNNGERLDDILGKLLKRKWDRAYRLKLVKLFLEGQKTIPFEFLEKEMRKPETCFDTIIMLAKLVDVGDISHAGLSRLEDILLELKYYNDMSLVELVERLLYQCQHEE